MVPSLPGRRAPVREDSGLQPTMRSQSIVPISIRDRILLDSPSRFIHALMEPGVVLSEVPDGMEMLYSPCL